MILIVILLVVVIEHISVECGDDDSDDDSDDGSGIGWPFTMPHKLFAGGDGPQIRTNISCQAITRTLTRTY